VRRLTVFRVKLCVQEAGQGRGEAVALLARRPVRPPLGVLQQRHEQEGKDRRGRVDDALPRVDAREQDDGRQPEDDDRGGDGEEPRPAHDVGYRLGEAIESAAAAP
jgi:hypothetical protein